MERKYPNSPSCTVCRAPLETFFKIELCPEVRSVYLNHFIARPYLDAPIPETPIIPLAADEADQRFRNESAFETSKADGFADDNTTGTIFEFNSLNAIKNILNDFSGKSGLKCNTEILP